ncbi:MAG: DUF1292 domain-containing protein [Clostridia bacterium]|nr:DUF1292 domain-containing protein [Clostridia bacterium]MBQ7093393.1 DUF1292 domain-containing protein [Clostridia bacterium]
MDQEKDFMTLDFDDGTSVECEILGVFEADGKEYIALVPQDGSEEIYFYGYVEINDEEFELVDILDDEEFEKAVAEFDRLTEEE